METFTPYKDKARAKVGILNRYIFTTRKHYFCQTMPERKYHGNAHSKADWSIIGPLKKLPKSDLPTHGDALANIFSLCK